MANVAPKDPGEKVKVILLGDTAVGKTKLVERFLLQRYDKQILSTYALNLFKYSGNVGGTDIEIDFWDTAGQERFERVHPSYYFQADACILVFDVTRKITYANLPRWLKELREYREKIPVIVCANKIDLDMRATKKGFNFAISHGFPLFYASAANGANIVKMFEEAIKLGHQYKNDPERRDIVDSVMDVFNKPVVTETIAADVDDKNEETE